MQLPNFLRSRRPHESDESRAQTRHDDALGDASTRDDASTRRDSTTPSDETTRDDETTDFEFKGRTFVIAPDGTGGSEADGGHTAWSVALDGVRFGRVILLSAVGESNDHVYQVWLDGAPEPMGQGTDGQQLLEHLINEHLGRPGAPEAQPF